ncbi:MAG: hypothetical protein QOJ03_1079 [Frankiaceae bacterium]|nr:hypothetical protein [Frankiaceae bacterium]
MPVLVGIAALRTQSASTVSPVSRKAFRTLRTCAAHCVTLDALASRVAVMPRVHEESEWLTGVP